jgi:hypothetical protein
MQHNAEFQVFDPTGCIHVISGRQVAEANKFCTVTTDVCESSVGRLFLVTILTPKILRLLLPCSKIYVYVFGTYITMWMSIAEWLWGLIGHTSLQYSPHTQ